MLLEREVELERLDHLLEAAAAGDGQLLVVEGSAGIGKTRLLGELSSLARSRGFVDLQARGGELEHELAFGVVRQLFERVIADATGAERTALFDGPAAGAAGVLGERQTVTSAFRPAGAGEDPFFAALHGLYWLAVNVATSSPALVCVDDAHWADTPSLRWLSYIARRREGMPVLIAIATRSGEPGSSSQELLGAVLADPGAEVIRPAALSVTAVATIVRNRLGANARDELCLACHEVTGGNPFLVGELSAVLAREAIEPTARGADAVRRLAPHRIARMVLFRIARISSEAIELARAVAVLGAGATLGRASSAAEIQPRAAEKAAGALLAADVLAGDGEKLRFSHPLVRASIYEDIPPPVRAAWHARAARLLADGHAPVQDVATQLLASEPSGEAWRVQALREAARDAINRGAPDVAARHLRRALRETPARPDPELLEELASVALSETGSDIEEIEGLLQQAWERVTDPDSRARLASKLASAITYAGDSRRAIEVLQEALQTPGQLGPQMRLRLQADLVYAARNALLPAETYERWMHGLADLAGQTPAERSALAVMVPTITDARTLTDVATRALGDAHLLREEGPDSPRLLTIGMNLAFADRLDLAAELANATLHESRARGSRLGFTMASIARSFVALRRGELVDAEAEARAALELGDEWHSPLGIGLATGFLAQSLVEQGLLDEAAAVIESHELAGDAPNVGFIPLTQARVAIFSAQGRREEALQQLTALIALGRMRPNLAAWAPARQVAAELLISLGRQAEARDLAQEALAAAEAWGAPSLIGIALRALALASDVDQQAELLGQAVAALKPTQARLELARALTELGAALRRRNDRATSREPLAKALELAHTSGAHPLADRARHELLATGARPRRLQVSGVDALTPSERRVAHLAATGMSNRDIAQSLFVTIKTVEKHLGNCYMKLDINSREQLRGALGPLNT